ncbi:MAG: MFS transporter, partial [Planctomycetota bacterium]|nr:MFS transporter [Planctomycetota bacterium]
METSRRGLLAWASYDWATGAFFTVVSTFVFAPYFQEGVVGNDEVALSQWSFAAGFAALIVAGLGPVLGAAADHGRRKPWLAVCTAVAVLATAGKFFVRPDPSFSTLAVSGVSVGT